MRKIKMFLQQSRPAMIDYILVVSTPIPEQRIQVSSPNLSAYKHQRIYILNSLRERSASMPTLHREAILLLPHLLDVSKHVAILTSAVVRNFRKSRSKTQCVQGGILDGFTRECCDVEDKALESVSQLIKKRNIALGRPSTTQAQMAYSTSFDFCRHPSERPSRPSTSSSNTGSPEDFVKIPSYPRSSNRSFAEMVVNESFRDVVWQTNSHDTRALRTSGQDDTNHGDPVKEGIVERNSTSTESGDETRKKRGLLAFLGKR